MNDQVLNTDDETAGGLPGLMLRMRGLGISDPVLLKAVENSPHERFIPVEQFHQAWSPISMPLACGQTMLSPDITIRLVQALNLRSDHSVLEIGTGSGFQTAILSALAKKVHTLDRYKTLLNAASERLGSLGRENVTFSHMDAMQVGKEQGLYDRVITDVAFEEQPRFLLDSLTVEGVVVAAMGAPRGEQVVTRFTKIGNRFEREELFAVRFSSFETGVSEAL